MTTYLTTVRSVRAALRTCHHVFIQPRFGCSEAWVKITKEEAKHLLAGLSPELTPEGAEMYSGTFGSVDSHNNLYLG